MRSPRTPIKLPPCLLGPSFTTLCSLVLQIPVLHFLLPLGLCDDKRLHQTPIGIAADETCTHSRLGNGLYAMYSAPTLPLRPIRPACCRQWPAITFASLRFYSRHIVIFYIFTIVIIHDSINASLPYQELNSSQFLSNVGLQTLFFSTGFVTTTFYR